MEEKEKDMFDKISEEFSEEEAVSRFIRKTLEECEEEAATEPEGKTSIQISKRLKRIFQELKDRCEVRAGTKVSYEVVLDILTKTSGGKEGDAIVKAIHSDGMKTLLRGTINAAHKCEYKIGLLKKLLEKTLPTQLLTRWIIGICNNDKATIAMFKNMKSSNPHCYSDDDITLLIELLPNWKKEGLLRTHVEKKIERLAIFYLSYSDMLRKITTGIIKADSVEIAEAAGFKKSVEEPII